MDEYCRFQDPCFHRLFIGLHELMTFVVVQSLKLCPTLCDPWTTARQASLSFTISWSLLKLMPIESVMPSSHLILYHPLLLLPAVLPSIRVFSNESVLHIRWLKYWSFSFNMNSFQWIFRTDFLWDWVVWSPCSSKDSQEPSPAPQFKGINSLVFNLLYGPTLTSIHDY